ncbi:MAG: hypothetical protein ACREM3_01555 [Candidatus Rokuibacteriota bacterium]
MKLLLTLVIVVAIAGGLAPAPAPAHGVRGGSSAVVTGRHAGPFARSAPRFVHKAFPFSRKSAFPEPVDPWKGWPSRATPKRHGVHGHPGFKGHRGFIEPFSSGFVGAPSVVVTTPYVVDGYGAVPVTYAPAAAVPPPAPFPTPTLIDYATGWYQLRGDGVTSPYAWVWIPRPPAAPAPLSEPALPPRPGETPPAASEPPPRAERGPAYHFTDEGGVTTWTNRLDRVPKRFRDQAAASATPE